MCYSQHVVFICGATEPAEAYFANVQTQTDRAKINSETKNKNTIKH